jgi:hypothetical protein
MSWRLRVRHDGLETRLPLTQRFRHRGADGFQCARPSFELFEQDPCGAVVQGGRAEHREVSPATVMGPV